MQIVASSDQKAEAKSGLEANKSSEMKKPEDQIQIERSPENEPSKDADNQIYDEVESSLNNDEEPNETAKSLEGSSKISLDIPDEPSQPETVNAEETT